MAAAHSSTFREANGTRLFSVSETVTKRVMTTLVPHAGRGELNGVDTIEYKGRPWLVAGGWSQPDEEGYARPTRIIRPVSEDFQAGGQLRGRWADYILSQLIAGAVIEGADAPPSTDFQIVEAPDVRLKTPVRRRIGSGR